MELVGHGLFKLSGPSSHDVRQFANNAETEVENNTGYSNWQNLMSSLFNLVWK